MGYWSIVRIGPLLAGKPQCLFPQVWEGLTLWEVGSTNPDFDKRCQQDRRVQRRVIIFLIMHDSFPLVGINAAISSWARQFFKKERKRKMQRMKERHREKERHRGKDRERNKEQVACIEFFLSWPCLKFPSCRNWIGYVPEPPGSEGSRAASRRRAEQCLTFISYSKPCLRTGWCRLGTPSLELYGVCVSPFWAKTIKDHDVCLFVFKYFCIELNFTLSS